MKKPVIGLTASFEQPNRIFITRHYADWLLKLGALPMILPYTQDKQHILEFAPVLDGLLLSGGGDLDPGSFNEEPHPKLGSVHPERDTLELLLTKEMLKLNRPILGICRGAQLLNVAEGGNMYQDLGAQYGSELLQHQQNAPTSHASHTLKILPDSKLAQILGAAKIRTNSFHHQAIKDPAPAFRACAFSADGVIEAIESVSHPFALGIQWHPECMPLDHQESEKIFAAFVQACRTSV